MDNPVQNDTLKKRMALRTAEEAARWLDELRSGHSKRHEEYLQWLLESPQHVEAFLQVSEVDASLAHIDPEKTIDIQLLPGQRDRDINVVALSEAATARQTRFAGWRRALAAGIALICFSAAVLWLLRLNQWTEYSTAIGEQRVISLEDGSLLHLNTHSRIKVGYSSDVRSVRLLAGEALFRVHQDPSRPFRVESGEAMVEVIGTQFDVWRRAGGSTVTVLEGEVRAGPVRQSKTGVSVKAGEEARVANDGHITRGKANLARVNGWPQRRLVFVNETLGAIAAEFNRYNRTPQIEVVGAAARSRDYSAMSFNADDPESLLAVLQADPGLEVLWQQEKVVIRQR